MGATKKQQLEEAEREYTERYPDENFEVPELREEFERQMAKDD